MPSALAQTSDYPNRPIRMFVGFPPGGAADLAARIVSEAASAHLGQPIVIENRPGSASNMAADAAAKAAPDGYSLLHAGDNMLAINPYIYSKMPFDPHKDLVPVGSVISNQYVLAIHPDVKAKNLKELVELARKSKQPMFYASIGNGSMHHLAMEVLKRQAKIDFTHVPYRGGGPAGTALMAGDVQAMFGAASIVPTIAVWQGARHRGDGPERWSALPDLPTVSERFPEYDMTVWHAGLRLPERREPILDRLRREFNAALKRSEDRRSAAQVRLGRSLHHHARRNSDKRIRDDYEKFGGLIKSIGLKID